MRLATLLAVLALYLADVAEAAWRPPVGGGVTRGFDVGSDPFAAGRHRGADLRAGAGTPVRAPCRGRVAVAGRVGGSGGVVTVLCGRWRVSHMPLSAIGVRPGAAVSRGVVLGTVARSRAHAGLHLGVRRDGARFGYVDPLRFLDTARPAPPLLVGRRGPSRRAPRLRRPRPVASPAQPGSSPVREGGVAPWPAWAGLALVLAGAGIRWRGRVQTRRGPVPGRLRREVV
jgi:Peptidase family M23